ncbi:MAG TPA: D-alanyl-D-alanine carboxypeptidase/D-alanyl-D-alanine-endopeptidase [Polyangia bacterium]|nr:D-alanyl-D-alanine carboxypeptidase/D-alanyl-D-alanine-endopeptidase [Polyangia bacterium]
MRVRSLSTTAAALLAALTGVAALPPPAPAHAGPITAGKKDVTTGASISWPAASGLSKMVVGPVVGGVGDGAARMHNGDELPVPSEGDRDRPRILHVQEMLRDIVHGAILRKYRVGMRVVDARSGRILFGRRSGALMDPASNQKVLATATAMMRLGAEWRFRTELSGPAPASNGVITGDVYLRGSGDPTLRSGDIQAMAERMARAGIQRIDGAIVADPRRIGTDELGPDAGADGVPSDDDPAPARPPLIVNRGLMYVRVRAGADEGSPAEITTTPSDDNFEIRNRARTTTSGATRLAVSLSAVGSKVHIDVTGKIAARHGAQTFRRKVPHPALWAGILLRAALVQAGVAVRDPVRVASSPVAQPLIERHESAPLGILLRRINKDSDNDQAERVLEAAGAEVYGGPPSPDKGVRLLREVIGELGLSPGTYVSRNGSGLGHANRITPDAMASLLRALYLDPRIGPEILQSLSVGGIDGTTRNRFKGSLAARRVRAKTGTLNGKSCLSGYVGDGSDVVVFSILIDGLRGKVLRAVRGAQVGAVNAMMRYVREGAGEIPSTPPDLDQPPSGNDFENGEEVMESDSETGESEEPPKPGEDPVDLVLKHERAAAAAARSP